MALAAGDRDLAGRAREVAVAVERNLTRAETAISGGGLSAGFGRRSDS
jgi:hypothetical protein